MDTQHIGRSPLHNLSVENVGQVQNEMVKVNAPGVLRGIEGGSLHFITVPNRDQEFIDHSLLNPEYITTHLPAGFIVDLISNPDSNDTHTQLGDSIGTDLEFHNDEQERKFTSLLQLVNKQYPIKMSNEAQVIVTNKDMATLTPIDEATKCSTIENGFLSTDGQQQAMAQTLLNENQFKLYQPAHLPSNEINVNPPLPPLTPIRRLNRTRKNSTINNQKEFVDSLPILTATGSNLLLPEIDAKTLRPLAKKSLPHKKRITKKLKAIDRAETQQNSQQNLQQRDTVIYQDVQDYSTDKGNLLQQSLDPSQFTCQICGVVSVSQIDFFSHLKSHYEPQPSSTISILQAIKSTIPPKINEPIAMDLPVSSVVQQIDFGDLPTSNTKPFNSNDASVATSYCQNTHPLAKEETHLAAEEVEFSDTEDMLEGIRGVVDKVQQSVDNDSSNDLNEKNWFNNNVSLNGAFNFKTEPSNQNIPGCVDNFSLFFKNEFIKEEHKVNDQNRNAIGEQDQQLKQALDIAEIKVEGSSNIDLTPPFSSQNQEEKKRNRKKIIELEDLNEETDFDVFDDEYIDINEEDEDDNNDDDDGDDGSGYSRYTKSKKVHRKKCKKCPKCGKLFNSTNALKYHDLSHTGERPHQCEVCGKSFFSLSALKVHMRLHSGEKPYTCEMCNRSFRQWGDLKYHKISIHTDEKNYQCEFCGKAFARRYSLVIHRRIHTSERNYKCEFCPKTFRTSSYLQNHRKVHTGEKPYACKVCGKKFRVSGDLKRHTKIHFREKKPKQAIAPSNVEPIKKHSTMITENKADSDKKNYLVYCDGNVEIFKSELNVTDSVERNIEKAAEEDAQTTLKAQTVKRKLLQKQQNIENSNSEKTAMAEPNQPAVDQNVPSVKNEIETEVTTETISVDLSKFLQKGNNLVYFW